MTLPPSVEALLDGLAGRRVVVAMSGGVDSSVAAALLVEAGCDVVGVTLQLYDHGEASGQKGSCCAGQDIADARRVAAGLGIPHYTLDYEKRFASAVMEAFADSYLAGETPIPCVTCNQTIKFHDLLETARELGADTLATGHYIEKRTGAAGPELYRAADLGRDQSYFLFATSRDQLAHLAFPLGGLQKSEVRALAAAFGLPVAEKADSQDICFVPKGRYTDVIERLKPGALTPGEIVHIDGRRLGRHDGVIGFTVGQRRGLGIPSTEPLFVVRIDAAANQVVVGPRDSLMTTGLVLKNVNWLGDEPFARSAVSGLEIGARVRSSQPPAPAVLFAESDGTARVVLRNGEDGVSAGQACVFYSDRSARARVLGGGWIATTLKPPAIEHSEAGAVSAIARSRTSYTGGGSQIERSK